MIKKNILLILTISLLIFSGCANSNLKDKVDTPDLNLNEITNDTNQIIESNDFKEINSELENLNNLDSEFGATEDFNFI